MHLALIALRTAPYVFWHSPDSASGQHDRQCAYNLILRRVRLTIVAVESNKYYKFWVCVCSLTYPVCKAHESYYIAICGMVGSAIFFHIIP
jgi:hypothetical protein